MKVIIIGAGISGLTFAATLQKRMSSEIELVIYERDLSMNERPQGYALGMDDKHALPVFQELNIYDELVNDPNSKKITNFVFQDQDGKELLSSLKISKKKIAYRIQREVIKSTLMKAIGPTPIHYGYQATHLMQEANGVWVEFANGERVHADYVIACDGASSKIRRTLINDEKNFLNLASISGLSLTPSKPECLEGGYYMGLGHDGSSIFIYRQPDGVYYSYTFPTDDPLIFQEKQPKELWQFVRDKTANWCELVRDIVQLTHMPTMNIRPYYDRHPINKLRYNRLWLMGDAAHMMSPFRGLGANLAMVGAYQLATLFAGLSKGHNELEMKKLEKKLLQKGKRAILESRRSAKNLHATNKILIVLRNSKFWFYRGLLKLI
jgi:2-polyprenyl-6-methoxyphenol hydroxylase-like FAD-dependent oxidoreductase